MLDFFVKFLFDINNKSPFGDTERPFGVTERTFGDTEHKL